MKIESLSVLSMGLPADAGGPSAVAAVTPVRAKEPGVRGEAAATTAGAASQPQDEPVDAAKVAEAAAELEQFYAQHRANLNFRVDDDTGELVISLIDPENGEVLRQIPAEEALRMAKALKTATEDPALLSQRA